MPLRFIIIALVLTCPVSMSGAAEPNTRGDVGQLQTILLETGRSTDGRFTLVGREAWRQLLVTGKYTSGSLRDLTRSARYDVTPAGIVAVDTTGLVTPLRDGQATITAQVEGVPTVRVQVTVSNIAEDMRINFANHIVPIFTKLGCNAGGCHGKASGQNGFKLSLFGFEPTEDFDSLVKDARGRRLFPAAPANSLLLLKATGAVAHAGGARLQPDTLFYHTLLRWIQQGAPHSQATDPQVRRIEVLPAERLMDRQSQQQLTVIAHLDNGTTWDVTRLALFDTNDADRAVVSETGLVSTQNLPGSAAIMVRFQEHATVFRATVPLGASVAQLPPAQNFVDELVYKQLKRLGLPPSALADDGTFLRRATIDIAGRLPRLEEVEAFLADPDPAKYEKLIDRLLDSEEYADYFANKWSAVLRNRRKGANDDPRPTGAFHKWIRESLRTNKPYDQFVRDVLTVTGTGDEQPQVIWYRELKEMTAQVEDMAQLFLGQHIACARCHHHPYEKWSQDDYWGLAAFFSRVEVRDPPPKAAKKGEPPPKKEPVSVTHKPGPAQAVNPKNNQPIKPAGLGSRPVTLTQDEDPRPHLVDWMTAPDNPFFAPVLVNRYWKHFFGRGLIEPEDDLRTTNPAANPELLEALAKSFQASKYDLKQLIRTICTANVYRFNAVPNEHNADDQQNFSRFLPRRLHAEVLLDALDDVTLARTTFRGAPPGTRAVQLPDTQFESYFLSVFGRPDATSACECERTTNATLAQALHLFNSNELLAKVAGPRAQALAKDKRPHQERLKELYLIALSRPPSPEEMTALLAHIDKKGPNVQSAYEDIIWALVNTKEFLFNR